MATKKILTAEVPGTEYLENLKALQDKQDLISDAVVAAANEAWDIQQTELIKEVKKRLEALGYRFEDLNEFNHFIQKRVYTSVIKGTTDNVVFLKYPGSEGRVKDRILMTYSTAVEAESKDGNITIKIG